jgi:hypothetical protein
VYSLRLHAGTHVAAARARESGTMPGGAPPQLSTACIRSGALSALTAVCVAPRACFSAQLVGVPPPDATIRIYYASPELRDAALSELTTVLDEMVVAVDAAAVTIRGGKGSDGELKRLTTWRMTAPIVRPSTLPASPPITHTRRTHPRLSLPYCAHALCLRTLPR